MLQQQQNTNSRMVIKDTCHWLGRGNGAGSRISQEQKKGTQFSFNQKSSVNQIAAFPPQTRKRNKIAQVVFHG